MDRLNALEAFVRVVEQGSFVRAAAALGLSTSALSQRVADLESHLGVRLLNRTTRKLSLTESGQALYERAVQVLADLGEAEALASSAAVEPRGTLKITCAHAIGVQRLAPAMAQFHALHPQVRFEVQVSDRMVDLVEEGFDLAIRIGSVVSEQLVARKLGQMRLLPCAAPSYLARHGRPRHPRDLAQHDLHGPDGAVHEVRAQGSLNANSGQVLVAAAVAGQGLVLETDFHVGDALARGELVRVLPEYEGGGGDIWAVYPSRRHLSAKLRLFVAHLVQEFAPAPTQRPARAARPPPRHARRR
jgi:DNA-binding transcriptional LysR family regulator